MSRSASPTDAFDELSGSDIEPIHPGILDHDHAWRRIGETITRVAGERFVTGHYDCVRGDCTAEQHRGWDDQQATLESFATDGGRQ